MHSISQQEKTLQMRTDTIYFSLSYLEHFDHIQLQPDELKGVKDTLQLFERFIKVFKKEMERSNKHCYIQRLPEINCLEFDEQYNKNLLDTNRLNDCIVSLLPNRHEFIFFHVIFSRGAVPFGSTPYGPSTDSQSAKYMPYLATIKDGKIFQFYSWRNLGFLYLFNDNFSIKREKQISKQILAKIGKN
jgi:hypothetical protein